MMDSMTLILPPHLALQELAIDWGFRLMTMVATFLGRHLEEILAVREAMASVSG